MRIAFLACTLVAAVAVHSAPAKADENYQFVKLTCAPELRFFEVSRIDVSNLPYEAELLAQSGTPKRRAFTQLARTRGIYDHETLAVHPFDCRITAKSKDPVGRGPWPRFEVKVRTISGAWAARVEVNGKSVGTIDLLEKHARFGVRSISVGDNGVGILVRVCTEGQEAGCRQDYLGNMQSAS